MKHRLLDEFKDYIKSVYSQPVHPTQESECEQAFIMGGFVAMNLLMEKLDETPEELEKYSLELYKFFKDYQKERVTLGLAMNDAIRRSESRR